VLAARIDRLPPEEKRLLQERRRSLHARIVEALEALAGDRVTEQVERLAHHALRGEVWDKALAYARQAGEKAVARSAHREAVGYFEQALSTLPHLPETRDTREQAIEPPAYPAHGALAVWQLGAYPGVSAQC
jgi:predicted ATPase